MRAATAESRADAGGDAVATVATIAIVGLGAAVLEAALVPGVILGVAAVLAPKVLPKIGGALDPLLRATVRGVQRLGEKARETAAPAVPDIDAPLPAPARFGVKRAIAKTVTFRIIVTSLDFTSNYVVIGELAAAVGLSTFALVAGPLFYFAHETAWNYFRPGGADVGLPALASLRPDAQAPPAGEGGVTISRAVAKTITFRTVATVTDFTANYVVVGELAAAVLLTAFAFVVGPFVYLGHEKAWDYYDPPDEDAASVATPAKRLPPPDRTGATTGNAAPRTPHPRPRRPRLPPANRG
ncbi:MAG TPA: DUF2061 domain-containing protein [Xanthobacteraceae bacterium]|nr:DUF2061 domain-containing protein [Xanthobacteraceae bacterium]